MHTCRISLIGGLSVLAALHFAVEAAESGDTRLPAGVRLTVSASDSIKESVTRCLAQELRALTDVRLVGDKPDWEITVLALDVQSTRGYRGGIVISAVMLPRFQNEKIELLFRPDEKGPGLAQTSNLWEHPSHSLHMDAEDRLQLMCRQIAAEFEAKQLAKRRKAITETQELPNTGRLPRVDGTEK